MPLWGILHRCAEQPEEFLYQPIWLPPVPLVVVQAAGLASGVLWSFWFYTRVQAYRRGELPLGHTLYMLSHLLVYLGGYLLIEDIGSGWLLVNVWHNVQYLAFVWLHNRRRFATGIAADAPVLSWLSQAGYGRATLYYLACLAVATPGLLSGPAWLRGGGSALSKFGAAHRARRESYAHRTSLHRRWNHLEAAE